MGNQKELRRSGRVAHSGRMKNDLELRTKRFALDIIRFVTSVKASRPADVLGRQLLKSGTSIGANYREAARAESRNDFIHKLAICEKEAAETEYWIELFDESRVAPIATCNTLLKECRELIAIIVASSRTAKSRL
jgi:four helix bundle protein